MFKNSGFGWVWSVSDKKALALALALVDFGRKPLILVTFGQFWTPNPVLGKNSGLGNKSGVQRKIWFWVVFAKKISFGHFWSKNTFSVSFGFDQKSSNWVRN